MPVWLARPVTGAGTLTRAGGNEQAACNSNRITIPKKSLEDDRAKRAIAAIALDIKINNIPKRPERKVMQRGMSRTSTVNQRLRGDPSSLTTPTTEARPGALLPRGKVFLAVDND